MDTSDWDLVIIENLGSKFHIPGVKPVGLIFGNATRLTSDSKLSDASVGPASLLALLSSRSFCPRVY
jgi:hypothetical protein